MTLIIILILGCQSTPNSESESKSRLEQVKELSYRSGKVNAKLDTEIKEDINNILGKIESIDSYQLFTKSNSERITEIPGSWESLDSLRYYSYDLWESNDLKETIIVYPSYSKDAVTGESRNIYVVEVEHQSLTGPCRMFFDSPNTNELGELVYVERN